jgi:hypothetical protein
MDFSIFAKISNLRKFYFRNNLLSFAVFEKISGEKSSNDVGFFMATFTKIKKTLYFRKNETFCEILRNCNDLQIYSQKYLVDLHISDNFCLFCSNLEESQHLFIFVIFVYFASDTGKNLSSWKVSKKYKN